MNAKDNRDTGTGQNVHVRNDSCDELRRSDVVLDDGREESPLFLECGRELDFLVCFGGDFHGGVGRGLVDRERANGAETRAELVVEKGVRGRLVTKLVGFTADEDGDVVGGGHEGNLSCASVSKDSAVREQSMGTQKNLRHSPNHIAEPRHGRVGDGLNGVLYPSFWNQKNIQILAILS